MSHEIPAEVMENEPHPTHYSIEFSCGDTNNGLERSTQKLDELLGKFGWSEIEKSQLTLLLQEVVMNAALHGSAEEFLPKGTPRDHIYEKIRELAQVNQELANKRVSVAIEITERSIMITVKDQGKGIKSEDLINPLLPQNVTKTTGRGMTFMHWYAHPEVRTDEEGCTVILKREKGEIIPTQ